MSGAEGPLAYAVRVSAEQDYVDGLAEGTREAMDRASGAAPEPISKRLLVHLSHSIERAVMSGPQSDPTVIVALFQQLPFFDREREVYARMADSGVHVIVGFADGRAHDVPDHVHLVTLDPTEQLADEWTVVAVGPQAGAFLVAVDQHLRDPHEPGAEAGRVFVGRWGYSRTQAGSELARLRFAFGDRLAPDVRNTIDELLARSMPSGAAPATSAGSPNEVWATTSLNHMIDRLNSDRAGTAEMRAQLADAQQAAAARTAADIDPSSGLPTGDLLNRWTDASGPDMLPVGVALFDLPGLDRIRDDGRAAWFAAHLVAAALTQPLGPVDAALRFSDRQFLLVVPGASERHLAGLCDRVGEQLALASQGYPGVPLLGRVSLMVTRTRPLPVEDLRAALGHLPEDPTGHGPIDAGSTPAGDRIIVAPAGAGPVESVPRAPEPQHAWSGRARAPGHGDDGNGRHEGARTEARRSGGSDGFDPVAPPAGAHAPEPRPAPTSSSPEVQVRPRPYLDTPGAENGVVGAGANRPEWVTW